MSEEQKLSKDDLFMLLLTQLSSGVWVQLGKLPDPATNKISRNLEAASMTIDIIDALAEKTKGNLNEDQDQFLSGTLSQLKMNYLEEMKKPDPVSEAKKPEASMQQEKPDDSKSKEDAEEETAEAPPEE